MTKCYWNELEILDSCNTNSRRSVTNETVTIVTVYQFHFLAVFGSIRTTRTKIIISQYVMLWRNLWMFVSPSTSRVSQLLLFSTSFSVLLSLNLFHFLKKRRLQAILITQMYSYNDWSIKWFFSFIAKRVFATRLINLETTFLIESVAMRERWGNVNLSRLPKDIITVVPMELELTSQSQGWHRIHYPHGGSTNTMMYLVTYFHRDIVHVTENSNVLSLRIKCLIQCIATSPITVCYSKGLQYK